MGREKERDWKGTALQSRHVCFSSPLTHPPPFPPPQTSRACRFPLVGAVRGVHLPRAPDALLPAPLPRPRHHRQGRDVDGLHHATSPRSRRSTRASPRGSTWPRSRPRPRCCRHPAGWADSPCRPPRPHRSDTTSCTAALVVLPLPTSAHHLCLTILFLCRVHAGAADSGGDDRPGVGSPYSHRDTQERQA